MSESSHDSAQRIASQPVAGAAFNNSGKGIALPAVPAYAEKDKSIFQPTQLKKASDPASTTTRFVPVQRKKNETGLPDNLKNGIEKLSGTDISDVKVNYNSSRPSTLQAHAYAQGTDIHVASGQEKHLPHEAWHVVQQKQGRVKPTKEIEGVQVNDNPGLESEADSMGAKALQMVAEGQESSTNDSADNPATHSSGLNTLSIHKELHHVARTVSGRGGNTMQLATEDEGLLGEEAKDGKMSKQTFLERIEEEAKAIADKQLEPLGQTSADCPFIDYWIAFYSVKTAAELEQAMHIYVPETKDATEPEALIKMIADKITLRLQEQIAKSGLDVVDPDQPDELKGDDGEAKDLTPPAQLQADGEVAQMGFFSEPEAFRVRNHGESSEDYKEYQQKFAAKKAGKVQQFGMPVNDGTAVEPQFTPGTFLYVSEEGGYVGSIYFTNGRIRLEHGSGPEISIKPGIQRFTVDVAGAKEFSTLKKQETKGTITRPEVYTTLLANNRLHGPTAGEKLLEFWGNNNTAWHISGGGPNTAYIFTQHQINIMVRGAQSHNNAVIRHYMNQEPYLQLIQTRPNR